MKRVRSFAAVSAVALGISMFAAPAVADAPELVKPNANQKAGIVKAWEGGGGAVPAGCLFVRLSKSNKHIAGLRSNVAKKPNKCAPYAFDGAALLYGQKKRWFVLAEGSDLRNSQCKATASLMGPQPWGDLVDFAALLGCENID